MEDDLIKNSISADSSNFHVLEDKVKTCSNSNA